MHYLSIDLVDREVESDDVRSTDWTGSLTAPNWILSARNKFSDVGMSLQSRFQQ